MSSSVTADFAAEVSPEGAESLSSAGATLLFTFSMISENEYPGFEYSRSSSVT